RDGLRVVTVSNDTARIWDMRDGKPLGEPLRHKERVNSAQFSPDGRRIVTACFDNTTRSWDAQLGKLLTEFTDPLQPETWTLFAQFSPDGRRVVTTSSDKTVRVWDARNGRELTRSAP